MSVHVHSDGKRYRVNYRDETGKKRSTSFPGTHEGWQRAVALDERIKKLKAKGGLVSPSSVSARRNVVFRKTKDYSQRLLRKKYLDLIQDPYMTLADLFDLMMEDMELPYSFKDVKKLAQQCNNARAKIPPSLRVQGVDRDNYTCQFCGRSAPETKIHVDHIVPLSRGGLTEIRNLQTLCFECNLGKSNQVASNAQ